MEKVEFERLKPSEVEDFRERWMIFCPEKCMDEIRDIMPKSCFGGIFPAVVLNGKTYTDKIIGARFDFEIDVFRGDSLRNIRGKTLLVLMDGMSEKAEDMLDRAFIKYGGITYLGGGAGSTSRSIDCLFDGDGFFRDNCLFISLPFDVDIQIRHGWKPTQFEFITTRTDGRRVFELDWKPAFETYKDTLESMGVDITPDNFFEAACGHPFGLRRLEGEMVLRDPIYVEGSTIVCGGKVPQNCVVSLMYGNTDSLLSAAEECAEVGSGVLFDCVSRALYMGKSFNKELKILKNASGALTVGKLQPKRRIRSY